jgi:hypothetical protein
MIDAASPHPRQTLLRAYGCCALSRRERPVVTRTRMGNTRVDRAEARGALATRTQSGHVAGTNRVTERRGVQRSDPQATSPRPPGFKGREVSAIPAVVGSWQGLGVLDLGALADGTRVIMSVVAATANTCELARTRNRNTSGDPGGLA